MEIERYQAFISAGVPEDKARSAADSIKKEIDQRHAAHSNVLVTQKDLAATAAQLELAIAKVGLQIAESRDSTVRWIVATTIALAAVVIAGIKLF